MTSIQRLALWNYLVNMRDYTPAEARAEIARREAAGE